MRSFTKKDAPKPAQIRALRESAGLSQTAAARKVFASLRTWQNWEAGTHCMHPIMWDSFRIVVAEVLETARCECRGECGKVHADGQCRSERGKRLEDARHTTVIRMVDGKLICQSCYVRLTETAD